MQQRKSYTLNQMKTLWKELADIPHLQGVERGKIASAEKSLLNFRPRLKEFTDEVYSPEYHHLVVLDARLRQLQHPGRIKQLEQDLREPTANLEKYEPQLAAAKTKLNTIETRIGHLATAIRLHDNRLDAESVSKNLESFCNRAAIHAVDIKKLDGQIVELEKLNAQDDAALISLNLALGQMRDLRTRLEQEQRERERLARAAAERAEQERLACAAAQLEQEQGGVMSSQQVQGGMSSSMSGGVQGGVTSSSMQSGGMHSSMQNNSGGTVSSQQAAVNYPDEGPLLTQIAVKQAIILGRNSSLHELSGRKSVIRTEYDKVKSLQQQAERDLAKLQKSIREDETALANVPVPGRREQMLSEYQAQSELHVTAKSDVTKWQGLVDANRACAQEIKQQLSVLNYQLTDTNRIIASTRALYPVIEKTTATDQPELRLREQKGSLLKKIVDENNLALLLGQQKEQSEKVAIALAKQSGYQDDVTGQELIIQRAEDEIDRLTRRQQQLHDDTFLISFRDEPQELVNALYNRVRVTMDNFAKRDDLHAQAPLVRAWLSTLQNKMNFVLTLQYRNKSDIERAQIQYEGLSGLIQRAIQQTEHARNQSFAHALQEQLSLTIIEKNHALSRYEALRGRHAEELNELTEADIARIDQINFDNAVAELRSRLATLPDNASSVLRKYYRDIGALLKNTEQRSAVARVKQQDFDLVLNTNILATAAELLFHPEDGNLRNKLVILGSNIKEGEQSRWKKVLGIIGAIIGGALLIAGGLGLQTILPGISLPASCTMIGIGATLFGGGIALAFNGRRKGFCKTLDDVDDRTTQVVNDHVATQSLQQVSAGYVQSQNVMFQQQPLAPVWDELPEEARPTAPVLE